MDHNGIVDVTCKCCGNKYKAPAAANSLTYSLTPNYGCIKCKGVSSKGKGE